VPRVGNTPRLTFDLRDCGVFFSQGQHRGSRDPARSDPSIARAAGEITE
jgi:hypothetical protein